MFPGNMNYQLHQFASDVNEPIVNKEKKLKVGPEVNPKVMTQNLFSIFTTSSKFTNVPGSKARKKSKPWTKKPIVSNTKYKTLNYFFKLKDGSNDDNSC